MYEHGLTFGHVKSVKIQCSNVSVKNLSLSKDSLLNKIESISLAKSEWRPIKGVGSSAFDGLVTAGKLSMSDQNESTTKKIYRRNFTYNDLGRTTGYQDKVWTSENPDIFTISTS